MEQINTPPPLTPVGRILHLIDVENANNELPSLDEII